MRDFFKLVIVAATIVIIGVIALLMIFSSAPNPAVDTAAAQATPAQMPEKPTWQYRSIVMDAGSKTEQLGCLRSDNMLHFGFPYNDNYARLCLRSDGSIIFSIASGQIMSGDQGDSRIRIGDDDPRTFRLDESSDNDSSVAFIEPTGPIFRAARAGKKIAIEATFFDAGVQTAIFSPDAPLSLRRPAPSRPRTPSVCDNGGC